MGCGTSSVKTFPLDEENEAVDLQSKEPKDKKTSTKADKNTTQTNAEKSSENERTREGKYKSLKNKDRRLEAQQVGEKPVKKHGTSTNLENGEVEIRSKHDKGKWEILKKSKLEFVEKNGEKSAIKLEKEMTKTVDGQEILPKSGKRHAEKSRSVKKSEVISFDEDIEFKRGLRNLNRRLTETSRELKTDSKIIQKRKDFNGENIIRKEDKSKEDRSTLSELRKTPKEGAKFCENNSGRTKAKKDKSRENLWRKCGPNRLIIAKASDSFLSKYSATKVLMKMYNEKRRLSKSATELYFRGKSEGKAQSTDRKQSSKSSIALEVPERERLSEDTNLLKLKEVSNQLVTRSIASILSRTSRKELDQMNQSLVNLGRQTRRVRRPSSSPCLTRRFKRARVNRPKTGYGSRGDVHLRENELPLEKPKRILSVSSSKDLFYDGYEEHYMYDDDFEDDEDLEEEEYFETVMTEKQKDIENYGDECLDERNDTLVCEKEASSRKKPESGNLKSSSEGVSGVYKSEVTATEGAVTNSLRDTANGDDITVTQNDVAVKKGRAAETQGDVAVVDSRVVGTKDGVTVIGSKVVETQTVFGVNESEAGVTENDAPATKVYVTVTVYDVAATDGSVAGTQSDVGVNKMKLLVPDDDTSTTEGSIMATKCETDANKRGAPLSKISRGKQKTQTKNLTFSGRKTASIRPKSSPTTRALREQSKQVGKRNQTNFGKRNEFKIPVSDKNLPKSSPSPVSTRNQTVRDTGGKKYQCGPKATTTNDNVTKTEKRVIEVNEGPVAVSGDAVEMSEGACAVNEGDQVEKKDGEGDVKTDKGNVAVDDSPNDGGDAIKVGNNVAELSCNVVVSKEDFAVRESGVSKIEGDTTVTESKIVDTQSDSRATLGNVLAFENGAESSGDVVKIEEDSAVRESDVEKTEGDGPVEEGLIEVPEKILVYEGDIITVEDKISSPVLDVPQSHQHSEDIKSKASKFHKNFLYLLMNVMDQTKTPSQTLSPEHILKGTHHPPANTRSQTSHVSKGDKPKSRPKSSPDNRCDRGAPVRIQEKTLDIPEREKHSRRPKTSPASRDESSFSTELNVPQPHKESHKNFLNLQMNKIDDHVNISERKTYSSRPKTSPGSRKRRKPLLIRPKSTSGKEQETKLEPESDNQKTGDISNGNTPSENKQREQEQVEKSTSQSSSHIKLPDIPSTPSMRSERRSSLPEGFVLPTISSIQSESVTDPTLESLSDLERVKTIEEHFPEIVTQTEKMELPNQVVGLPEMSSTHKEVTQTAEFEENVQKLCETESTPTNTVIDKCKELATSHKTADGPASKPTHPKSAPKKGTTLPKRTEKSAKRTRVKKT